MPAAAAAAAPAQRTQPYLHVCMRVSCLHACLYVCLYVRMYMRCRASLQTSSAKASLAVTARRQQPTPTAIDNHFQTTPGAPWCGLRVPR